MKNSILRFGSLTILVSLALLCLAQVVSVAIAYGNPSQGPGAGLEPPFRPGHGLLPDAPGARYAGGPPNLPGIGRHGRAGARSELAFTDVDASSIFLEAPQYDSGGHDAYSVAVADVNGDGKPDLLVANQCASTSNCANGGSVGVLLGNGDGTFQPAVSYNSGGEYAYSIAVADMNGDGHPDLLVANQCAGSNCQNGGIGVLLGNGDGTFQPAVTYNSGGVEASSVAVADVNGDGKLDLLVANICVTPDNCSYGSAGVLLGNGDGTFQAAVTYNSGGVDTYSIAVADVNSDGMPDLLVANQCASSSSCANGGSVGVLLGNGDGTFQPQVSYNSGGYWAHSIAMADVNGDGHPDLLVANQCASSSSCANGGSVGVLLGNGDGTFQPPVSYSSSGEYAYSIAVADVNGDGHPDLLVANQCAGSNCQNGGVGVLLGNGDGTFQPAVSYNSGGEYAYSIAVADVNGDGHPDLVVASECVSYGNCANGAVSVLLGNGDGIFQAAVNYNSIYDASSIAVADVNGDGHPDLLVTDQCFDSSCMNGGVSVLSGNGDGTFQPAVSYNSGGENALSIAVADVNGDRHPDLLVSNFCGSSSCSNGAVSVLLGNGDGTFQPAVSYNSGGYGGYSIAVADVNGDGHPDLLVANECAASNCQNGGVGVLLGNGDGTFQSAVSYNSGGYFAISLAVADVNGDGKPDLLVAHSCLSSSACSNGTVSVLLGNGDGTFQAAVSYNSGGYLARALAVADMNGDGIPDLVVGNYCASSSGCNGANGGSVGVLLGNGDGTFQAAQTTPTPSTISEGQIAVADFNGDGKLDAAIGSGGVLLLGNGDGTFQTPLALGAWGLGTAAGDFNGDGRPDLAVGGVTILINAPKQQPQSITFTTNAPASATYNSQFTVAATASSGLPVAFTSSGSCTNSGATYTMTSGTGACSVIANQAGNSYNAAAPTVTETVNAIPLTQAITFTTPAPATSKSGDIFTVAATGGATGNPVIFTVGAGSVCTNSGTNGATFTMTSNTGTCLVIANQAGNNNYAAAQATETVTAVRMVTKVAPTVTFTGAPASAAYLSSFTVATTENSGITPTIVTTTGGVCTVSGTTVTMKKGTGTCTVKASWATDAYYLAASLTQSTTAALLGTTTTITNTIPQATHPLKVEVYFTVTNGMNAVAGNVTVTASSGEHCTGTVLGGKCLLTFAVPGSKTLNAVYAGNTDDATSTSVPYALTVN